MGFGFWVSVWDFGFRIWGLGSRIRVLRFWGVGLKVEGLVFGLWCMVIVVWGSGFGVQGLGLGFGV